MVAVTADLTATVKEYLTAVAGSATTDARAVQQALRDAADAQTSAIADAQLKTT